MMADRRRGQVGTWPIGAAGRWARGSALGADLAGQDVPGLFTSETDGDADFAGAVADPDVVALAWEAWRAEVELATRFVADAPSLDLTADDPLSQHGSGGGPMSLREVLVGTIEEFARHLGHVDLLRERIDGRIGQ